MKIGIITIFDSENFGNKLQNYALHRILLEYADEVVTIRNKPKFHSLWEFLRRRTALAESVWLNRWIGKGRKAKILQFQKDYIPTSHHSYCCGKSYRNLMPGDRCDGYCIGSDQVWNPELGRTGGFNYGSFAGGAVFSYAASFGAEEIPEKYRQKMGNWLRQIPYLSLREQAGQTIVRELAGREDAQVHIDPTLLLSREVWTTIARKPKAPLPRTYLLLYFLGGISPERAGAIAEKAEQLGLEIVNLMEKASPFYEIGPEEFLCLVQNAALVYTDSFHASVFSFLFQRSLVIFPRAGNMGSRLDTFTRTFHLEVCMAEGESIPDVSLKVNYTSGFLTLEAERKKARAYWNLVFAKKG